ncbi:MAG: hypothetical protein K5678_10080 [Acetatifactor sp.]|nr:hypothetical protein [Acetatifactor sp.]
MPKENQKHNWIVWLIAALIFLVLLLVFAFAWHAKKSARPKTIVFGDSLMAIARGEDSVPDRLSGLLGEPVFNAAFGGTTLAKNGSASEELSMAALKNAVIANDFAPQQQVSIQSAATEYFDELVDALDASDFQGAELLLVTHGMNDYLSGVLLENSGDPFDEGTYAGALRTIVTDLGKAFPNCRIILVTPTFAWYCNAEKSCEEIEFGGGTLDAYAAKEREVAAELGVELIDLYDLYEHEKYEDWERFTSDGVHPNATGRELIAERIAAYLEEHP